MRIRHSERGTVALEFALLLPVILLFIGALMIAGMRGVYSALAQHEARVGAREASIRLGQASSDPYPTQFQICDSPNRLLAFPGSDFIQAECTVSNSSAPTARGLGTGDIVTVTLVYRLPAITALSDFVENAFNAGALAVVSQSASVMRE